MRHHDLVFLKHFSQVIAILVGICISLILLGMYFNRMKPVVPSPSQVAAVKERIQPVGAVYAGSTGAAAQAAAAAAAAEALKGAPAWGEGTLDGGKIFEGVCTTCHANAAMPAPKLTHAEWGPRIAQGVDTLHKHAIEGFTGAKGTMPAKGGQPTLTDEQVKATVDWMLKNLK